MRAGANCERERRRFAVRQPRYHRTLHPSWHLRVVRCRTLRSPVDRWLCVPTFQRVCPKTGVNMHNRPKRRKVLFPLLQ